MLALGRHLGRALSAYHHKAIHLPRVERVQLVLGALIAEGGGADSLLDVGCGDGSIARAVARHVGASRVMGVDTSLRQRVAIEAQSYHQGEPLPFPDNSFDAVLLADVLHHAHDPHDLLAECLRVARHYVALKDHFAFGFWSERLLWAMDVIGNASAGVEVTGQYLRPEAWVELVNRCGGHIAALRWPLRIHDMPWRTITRSSLQFAARIEHATPPKQERSETSS